MKNAIKALVIYASAFGLLATATSAHAEITDDLTGLISALPPSVSKWVAIVAGVLYVLAQIRAILPPSITDRIPSVIVKLLDLVAANYKHAKNASTVTATEPVDTSDQKYRAAVETAKQEGKIRGSSIENSSDSAGTNSAGSKQA